MSQNLLTWANEMEKRAGAEKLIEMGEKYGPKVKRIASHIFSPRGTRPNVPERYNVINNEEKARKAQEATKKWLRDAASTKDKLRWKAQENTTPVERLSQDWKDVYKRDQTLRDIRDDATYPLWSSISHGVHSEVAHHMGYKDWEKWYEGMLKDITSQNPSKEALDVIENNIGRWKSRPLSEFYEQAQAAHNAAIPSLRDIKNLNHLNADATINPETYLYGADKALFNEANKAREIGLGDYTSLSKLRRFYENEPTPEEWEMIDKVRKGLIGAGLLGAGYAAGRASE